MERKAELEEDHSKEVVGALVSMGRVFSLPLKHCIKVRNCCCNYLPDLHGRKILIEKDRSEDFILQQIKKNGDLLIFY